MIIWSCEVNLGVFFFFLYSSRDHNLSVVQPVNRSYDGAGNVFSTPDPAKRFYTNNIAHPPVFDPNAASLPWSNSSAFPAPPSSLPLATPLISPVISPSESSSRHNTNEATGLKRLDCILSKRVDDDIVANTSLLIIGEDDKSDFKVSLCSGLLV